MSRRKQSNPKPLKRELIFENYIFFLYRFSFCLVLRCFGVGIVVFFAGEWVLPCRALAGVLPHGVWSFAGEMVVVSDMCSIFICLDLL